MYLEQYSWYMYLEQYSWKRLIRNSGKSFAELPGKK
jgi:hypothetical protein